MFLAFPVSLIFQMANTYMSWTEISRILSDSITSGCHTVAVCSVLTCDSPLNVSFNRILPLDASRTWLVSHLLQDFMIPLTWEMDSRMLGVLLSNRKLVMDGKSNWSGESPQPHIQTVLKELHTAPVYLQYKTVSCGDALYCTDPLWPSALTVNKIFY
jgi:hypothetical protein